MGQHSCCLYSQPLTPAAPESLIPPVLQGSAAACSSVSFAQETWPLCFYDDFGTCGLSSSGFDDLGSKIYSKLEEESHLSSWRLRWINRGPLKAEIQIIMTVLWSGGDHRVGQHFKFNIPLIGLFTGDRVDVTRGEKMTKALSLLSNKAIPCWAPFSQGNFNQVYYLYLTWGLNRENKRCSQQMGRELWEYYKVCTCLRTAAAGRAINIYD